MAKDMVMTMTMVLAPIHVERVAGRCRVQQMAMQSLGIFVLDFYYSYLVDGFFSSSCSEGPSLA